MSTVGSTMSTPGVFSMPGDIMSTPGAYHDEWGGYHEYSRGCSVHQGDTMGTLGAYHGECGDIMSTVGVFSTLGDYHEYIGGCSVHRRDTMSTPGDFAMNEKKPRPNFEDFVLAPFPTVQLYMLALEHQTAC